MKIAFITKYPPIQGGVSTRAYWLIRGLAEKGHEIHVITNAWEVEEDYQVQIKKQETKYYQPQNVKIHSTNPFGETRPIPYGYSNPYTEKLANLAIKVIREYNCELIDSWYTLPYVLAGYIAKSFTKKPQIMRHGLSDIYRLWNNPQFKILFNEVYKKIDVIVTHKRHIPKFKAIHIPASRLILLKPLYSVNNKVFNPRTKPLNLSNYSQKYKKGVPILTYIGKIRKRKGPFKLLKAAAQLRNENFLLLFITNRGPRLQSLKDRVKELKLDSKTIILGFLPPWRIPSVLTASTCVVKIEYDFPIPHHNPAVIREALACGSCLLISNDLHKDYHALIDGETALVVDPRKLKALVDKLRIVINNPNYVAKIGRNARKLSERGERFEEYIQSNINLYQQLMNK